MVRRKIIRIDENLCNGCGNCVSPCAEGAIEIVNGKARLIKEELCDGAGFCLGVCPTGAMTIEERKAEAFSEEAVEEHLANRPRMQELVLDCSRCHRDENEAALFAVRYQGTSVWVCAKCLPALIHG
ncbi:MAG: ATP-binding protein [Bacillota bacterium]|jgi:Na+-translocating ferredoxin:NAD+ oxidoreductase RNF subunit RnfB